MCTLILRFLSFWGPQGNCLGETSFLSLAVVWKAATTLPPPCLLFFGLLLSRQGRAVLPPQALSWLGLRTVTLTLPCWGLLDWACCHGSCKAQLRGEAWARRSLRREADKAALGGDSSLSQQWWTDPPRSKRSCDTVAPYKTHFFVPQTPHLYSSLIKTTLHITWAQSLYQTAFPWLIAGSWVRTGIGTWTGILRGQCCHRWKLYPLYHNTGPIYFIIQA